MILGTGLFRYRYAPDWGRGPEGVEDFGQAVGIAVDADDHIHVATRSPVPRVLVFDRAGRLLRTWGEDVFTVVGGLHSIWISPAGEFICADALDHTVRRFSAAGALLAELGTAGKTGEPGMPFNMPTKAVLSPTGEYFVADGYGQERVHRFSPEGRLLVSWGSKGNAIGQLDTPHSIWIDRRGRVLVADRANHRIQIFDRDGAVLSQWTDVLMPMDFYIDQDDHVFVAEGEQRISVFDLDGTLLARWGEKGSATGQFSEHPHALSVDSHGDLYVCEVVSPNLFHKFERV
jgi:DNA-binding beta-propeller fold protein YncE